MDEICENAIYNNSINHVVYENYQQGSNKSFTNADNIDVICSRGQESFRYSSSLVSNNYIICNNGESCHQVDYINANVSYCGGEL